MLRDMISHVKNTLHFAGTYSSTKTPTNGIDLTGYSSCTILCAIGAMTNSGSGQWTFTLQESDSQSSGFSTVGSADVLLDYGLNDGSISSGVFATVDAASEDEAVYTIGYIGSKRYVRVVATAANTPGNTAITCAMALGALQKPQDDS